MSNTLFKKLKPTKIKTKENKEHSRYIINKEKYKKILVHNIPFIFTCDEQDKIKTLKNYSIEIKDEIITAVIPSKKFNQSKYDLVYDAGKRGGTVVMPGLINTHAHIHMYLLRSAMMLDEGQEVDSTINEMAKWQKNETDSSLAIASIGDLTEQQKNGITTTLTHGPSFQAHEIASKASHHNLFNAVSAVSNSRPSNNPKMVEKILKQQNSYHSTPAISLHYLYKTPINILEKIRDLSEKYDALVTFHMAESPFVAKETIKKHGLNETMLMKKVGLLNNRSIASHVLHVDKKDINLMSKNNVGIAHLPTSNAIHKSGVFPIWDFIEAKGFKNISLGTDSVVSKNRLDILTEAYQARLTHLYKKTLKFSYLFRMMTINGARVLNMSDRGKIQPGMKADLIFWKLKDRGFIPYDENNPITLLGNIITHNGRTVRDLMINGEFIIKNRIHQLIDESRLQDNIQDEHMRMRKRLK